MVEDEEALGAFGKSQTYRSKEVNMAAEDFDDALVMFKLRSGKVRLADDKTLYIESVGDVVLKTYFGTSWTLKDVRSYGGFNANLQLSVAERLSRTFRAESTGIYAEALKMLWADSVSTAYLIYCIPYVPKGLRIPEEDEAMKMYIHRKWLRLNAIQSQVVLVDIPENLAENDSIVAEHRLSSKISQSLGGRLRDSIGMKIYQRVYGSRKKKAIIEKMVSLEKNQTCSLVRISAGKKASQILWMFKVKEEHNGRKRYKAKLVVKGFQQKRGVGDEREVEVLRSFNWPPSELITEDGVLPERGYSQFNDVSSGYLVSKVS
nr:retrovirus-related Pol polyprotein from transposon TNT 1-94 [Tanacetum cinerariifolium]